MISIIRKYQCDVNSGQISTYTQLFKHWLLLPKVHQLHENNHKLLTTNQIYFTVPMEANIKQELVVKLVYWI